MKKNLLNTLAAVCLAFVFFGALSLTNNKPDQIYKVAIIDKNKIIHVRDAVMVNGYLNVRLDGKNND
tara:strand:+ start:5557 stop:5757 length:201 start_codon:yes stop_codon:yes gene_type:complete